MSTWEPEGVGAALFPKARRAVLALLLGHPGERFHLRAIVQQTGLGQGHVQREVERLTRAGVLRRTEEGRHVFYAANEACPVYDELRRLLLKTSGAAAQISAALRELEDRIAVAFLHGSVVRGDETEVSDLDLIAVGEASFADVVECLRDAERRLARTVNPTVYPPAEFLRKARGHFLRSVLAGEKLFVIGGPDELATVLGE